jgi:hypothetical protein
LNSGTHGEALHSRLAQTPRELAYQDTSEAGHRRVRTNRNRARTLKGRTTEDLDRATRNRRPRCPDRIGQGSESPKQAVENTKDAFGRDGSGTR